MRTWTGSGESGNPPTSLRPLAWKAGLLAALLLAPLVTALYALLRAPLSVLVAVLCVAASAEVCFYFWWRERSNGLCRMRPSEPQHLEPEKVRHQVLFSISQETHVQSKCRSGSRLSRCVCVGGDIQLLTGMFCMT